MKGALVGVSTDAILAYGYDLGGEGSEWLVRELDESSAPSWPWLEDGEDFLDLASSQLLTAAGLTESDWYAREGHLVSPAMGLLGVDFVKHCSQKYPNWVLAAHVVTVHRGYSALVDFGELDARRVEQDWDIKLARALQLLGITPVQLAPKWLLVSFTDGFA
jgi:hypothetical protein